jgi:integrase/recombinase XerD
MLTIFRRHLKTCKHAAKGRKYRTCGCPLSVEGRLRGEMIRKSLDLRNWENAQRLVREWEAGTPHATTVTKACERFMADCAARKLSDPMYRKYKHITEELKKAFGDIPLSEVTTDDLRRIRESWKLAPITMQKRMEMIRAFFTFCLNSDWIKRSPAKAVKTPVVQSAPTLPFTDLEMEKILWAAESIREAHPKMPKDAGKKLKALILLMRYSGLRISDAVMFRRETMKNGKLFLRQEKTKEPVWVPLPPDVVKAVMTCDEGDEYFFYRNVGTPKSAITDWQWRLRKVYDMAGVPSGHSHRLRDTFSVDLLSRGVSLETVSRLLGHTSIKTTQKHYAPFVKSSQDALEAAVKGTWAETL